MSRPTRAVIDLDALRANFRRAAALASPARAMAVVKADGYGHGLEPVARALADLTPAYAVACLEEALRLRNAGLRHPIVLLEGVHQRADLVVCGDLALRPVVHSDYQIQWLEAVPGNSPTPVWLKVNTGMNRLGFAPEEVGDKVLRLRRAGVELVGLMTHLACADEPESPMTVRQVNAMIALQETFPDLETSVANSAGHFRKGMTRFDWTRPGIMLYGGAPLDGQTPQQAGVRPVMRLESQLIAVRNLRAGQHVGYGGDWTADRDCPMGVVAIGYGDGYPRHAPSGTPVWVAGAIVPLIGRVSMDMLAVDLTGVAAEPGAPVELWGEHLSVDEVARHAGTISYELLTGVTARVPRQYLEEA